MTPYRVVGDNKARAWPCRPRLSKYQPCAGMRVTRQPAPRHWLSRLQMNIMPELVLSLLGADD